jgi:hypothetical protein
LRLALLLLFSLPRRALLLLFLLLRRALLFFVLLLRLLLLLFIAPCQGAVPRAARVVVLRLQRRACAVSLRHPLRCRIVRHSTRRTRG